MSAYAISAGYSQVKSDTRATGMFFALWALVALTVTSGLLAVLGVITFNVWVLLSAALVSMTTAYGALIYWLNK